MVTDGFLSQCSTDATGFSIIESPFINRPEVKNIILSEMIYDKKKKKLSIFKPPHSGRPLYYHINSRGEFYCSTHISMLKKAGVTIEENTDGLPEFFVYRYVTPPKTLYKNIHQVSIGSHLYFALMNGQCILESEHQYNPFSIKSEIVPESISMGKIIQQINANLSHAINLLSPCSSRLSVLLSGGLDSSILFAICRNTFGTNKSYSTSYPFEDASNDREKKYALSAAKALNSNHYFYQADNNEYLHGFLESISTAEEPLHHLQSVMLYLLFKKGLPTDKDIVISGEGADGIFGSGLHKYIYNCNHHKATYRFLSKEPFFSFVKAIAGRESGIVSRIYNIQNSIDQPLEDPAHIIYSQGNYGSEKWVCDYFNVKRKDIIENRYEAIKSWKHHSIYDVLSMLSIVGEMSMSQSIWSKLGEGSNKVLYYPFSNRELLNNACSIKWETKLKHPKNILRGVARDLHIPKFIIERPKSGFGISASQWANKRGIFEPLVPLASKCFDKNIIMNMQSIEPKSAMTFWNILNYSMWKRLCIDNEPLDILCEELSRSISDRNY
jgi:asparagine synthetase B (glutamine-hydrolysing)